MPRPLRIRAGRRGDLDAIAAIETAVFDLDRLSRRSLRRFLTVPTTATVVAAADGIVCGYAMIGFRAGSRVGRLFSLAVVPDQGRRGAGRRLLHACETAAWRRGCTAVRLEVRADNRPAIALYASAGYRQCGLFEDYYEDGAPALRFAKAVPASAVRTG